jgi:hypothetical protein
MAGQWHSLVNRVATLMVVMVTVAACTQSSGQPVPGGPWRVTAPAATAGAQVGSHGWSLRLVAPAPRGELSVAAGPAGDAPSAQALTSVTRKFDLQAGEPVELALTDGGMPAEGAVVTRTRDVPVPEGAMATLAYYDAANEAWTAVPTTISADRRTLTAIVHHLSPWDDIVYAVTSVISNRRDKPQCDQPTPPWLDSAVFLDDKNAPVRWCAGQDKAHPELLVVKVAINRPFGAAIIPAVKPQWAWDSLFEGGPDDVLTGLLARTLDAPTALTDLFGGRVVVAGGSEADFGFTEEQVRQVGAKPLVTVDGGPLYMLAGLIYTAVSEDLGKGDGPAAMVTTLISLWQCAHDFGDAIQHRDWARLTGAALACVESRAEDIARDSATLLTKLYPTRNPRELGALAGTAARKLRIAWAIGKVFQLGEWTADSQLDSAAWRLTAFPTIKRKAPVPTLGKVWAPSQEGYGTIRPSTIFNGGDPTGLVTDVHWKSWGGPTAEATGTSIDDSHSVDVASAPQAQAVVVAFNLGTCDGKPMYQAIEWYFPSSGQQFDPENYINICTGEYHIR